MPSLATRMQPVQPETTGVRIVKGKQTPSKDESVVVGRRSLPELAIIDSETCFTIDVPLQGIEPRNVLVSAMPKSIVIEIRLRDTFEHEGVIHREIQSQRLIRELKLNHFIAKGATFMHMCGDSLQVTCMKTSSSGDESWSEFIQQDTRASLGCV